MTNGFGTNGFGDYIVTSIQNAFSSILKPRTQVLLCDRVLLVSLTKNFHDDLLN